MSLFRRVFHSLLSRPSPTDPAVDDGEPQSIFLFLPTELLVRIISFLAARDKTKVRAVSRRLRSVSETPSLWSEFVWPDYHTGDEGCVKSVLKVCGQHVKRLFFQYHEILHEIHLSRLMIAMGYCNNLIELSLPTTRLDSELLNKILFQIIDLRRLEVQCWDSIDIKQLLDVVDRGNTNLEVLTIRLQPNNSFDFPHMVLTETASWVDYWISIGLVPQTLNIVFRSPIFLRDGIIFSWNKVHYKSIPHHTGHIEVYSSLRVPLDLRPVLPKFQLEFGHAATLPYTKLDRFGLNKCIGQFAGKNCCKVLREELLNSVVYIGELQHGNYDLESLIEFDVANCDLCPGELEKLATACPNLQQLDLMDNDKCLTSLQGLYAIASFCHNLQGLNLLGISSGCIESQIQLWEILSGMKLTHLAIDLSALLAVTEDDKLKLVELFQKCTCLQAMEFHSSHCHGKCSSILVDGSMTILSHFPSLVHCVWNASYHRHYITGLQDVLTSCKKLKYLYYDHDLLSQSLSTLCCTNLQQLYIDSYTAVLSNTFMSAISAHGGLVHVVLNVKSLTSEGVVIAVANSPSLITFHIVVTDTVHNDKSVRKLKTKIKQIFSQRQLFTSGNFTIERVQLISHCEVSVRVSLKQQYYTNLFSLWR